MKSKTLLRTSYYAILFGVTGSMLASCSKSEMNEVVTPETASTEKVTGMSKGLFVSAADTAAATRNLWFYGLTPPEMIDSTSYASNAKDGNGIFYFSAKDELYQLGRRDKTVYVFENASSLSQTPIPARTITDPTLSSGREITYDRIRDILYIANNTDSTIRMYKNFSIRSGNVTGTVIKIQGQPWGIFFDESRNRLIVVIDQAAMRLDIFDKPGSLSGNVTASRSLNITNRPMALSAGYMV